MLHTGIDILENEIIVKYPEVLDTLLYDHTTKKNILWGTDNYEYLGKDYLSHKEIKPSLITGKFGNLIMPRIKKDKILQQSRSRNMAEVFTPSWVCNAQNNLIDNAWFGKKNIFNKEIKLKNGAYSWKINSNKVNFPKQKTWKDYIKDRRLELACGEAPYITSRYDATNGYFIPVNDRIGIIDRKLRVINENVSNSGEWLKAAQIAYKSTYAYEWQGDNLLLAREALLFTFIENYIQKFNKEPLLRSIKFIAYIISWNVWQMDGLKGVIPYSCKNVDSFLRNLFGENEKTKSICKGCFSDNIQKHNGIYCLIKDWSVRDKKTGKKGRRIRYIDLLNNQA